MLGKHYIWMFSGRSKRTFFSWLCTNPQNIRLGTLLLFFHPFSTAHPLQGWEVAGVYRIFSSHRRGKHLGQSITGHRQCTITNLGWCMSLNWGGNWSTWRKPALTQGEHGNCTERPFGSTGTLLAVRRQRYPLEPLYCDISNLPVNIWRVQMQKPLSAIWNFLLEWSFLSSLYY